MPVPPHLEPPPDTPEQVLFMTEFLYRTWPGISELAHSGGGRVEAFTVEEHDHGISLAIQITYRDHRYRFRAPIWPTSDPAVFRAMMVTTGLEERLFTLRHPPHDPDDIIDLTSGQGEAAVIKNDDT